jgi:nicotinate-nucleotide pyrophosphorylase (carboxylating)
VTRKFVDKTKGTKAKILDTRKTTPNLRILEKYAVKTGGGLNHRQTLVDAILIKDNHLRAGRFLNQGKLDEERLGKCIRHLRNLPTVKIEIEVETLDEFKAILKYKPHVVMLDNFIPSQIREAVKFRNQHFPKIKLEASGGISMENVKEIAEAGVDFISIGSLTHSPKAIDFSLEIIEHR